MQRSTKTNNQKKRGGEQEFLEVTNFKVTRVRETLRGAIMFDLILNGVYIYGLSVWTNRETGADYIKFPSQKASNGKYYSIAWAKLSDDDSDAILKEVEVQLNAD